MTQLWFVPAHIVTGSEGVGQEKLPKGGGTIATTLGLLGRATYPATRSFQSVP
jgi:hypothetical protein